MSQEVTFVFIKPDGRVKHILGDVDERFEKEGLRIIEWYTRKITSEECDEHYAHIMDQPFYKEMKEYIISDYSFFMIVKGENAIQRVRELIGPTRGAPLGTIRGDFGSDGFRNLIHASDSYEAVVKEIARFQ